jgi:DegV family protein with EDD domain
MPKIAIITDTDASLPAEIASQYGIRQVPIIVQFGEETFRTSVDIDDVSLFERVDRENKLPTTSAPSPGAFVEAFQSAFDDGADAIVCICVSSEISATYGAALTAAETFTDRDITVVDSLTLSMAQGFMALAAAEAAQNGASVEEIVALTTDIGPRMHVYAALSTLKYLAMSGRVGKLAAGMADTFNVKPILSVQDGKLDLLEKVRTQKKAVARVLDLVGQSVGDGALERMAIIHVNNPEGARALQQQICAQLTCPDSVIIAEFSAGLSVHAGSGVVGVVIVTKR